MLDFMLLRANPQILLISEDYIFTLFVNIIKIYNNSIVKNLQDVQFP